MKYLNARNTAFGEDRRSYKTGTNGVTSNQTVFNVSYDNGRVEAYLNGVRLYPGDDFTKASSGIGTSITLASAIGTNNVLEVVGYQGINSGNALVEDNFVVGANSTGSGGSYSGSTTVFPVASSAGDTVSVWRNGVKLVPTTDYTVQASASTVTLLSAASPDDEITVQVVGGVIHNNGLTVNSGNDSFFLPTTRGTDGYVLTRDDTVGIGGTAWKETLQGPIIIGIKYSNQTSGTFTENSGQTATGANASSGEEDLVQIIGQNFDSTLATPADASNIAISIDGTSATSISVNSAGTEATFKPPAKSAGSYTLTATNASGLSASITISYDADPTWVTASAPSSSLGNFVDGSITGTNGPQIVASESGSNLTTGYKRVTNSTDNTVITTAIAGLTLGDNGYLTGTLAGTDGATNTFYAVAHDNEGQQSAIRQFHFISYDYPGAGGTIVEPANYSGNTHRSHTFFNSGNGTATNVFTLYKATTVDVLLVGGGGGGGTYYWSGGGGAGGMLEQTSVSLSAGTYTVVVGAGGAGQSAGSTNHGNSGYATTFHTFTAFGGGGGGTYDTGNNTLPSQDANGNNLGSGGGGIGHPVNGAGTSGTSGQGNSGGSGGGTGNPSTGGGGGGKGGFGTNGGNDSGGNGGAGATNYWRDGDISGTTAGIHLFAAGGGGSTWNGTGGRAGGTVSGVRLGGNGGNSGTTSNTDAVANTGSGGGAVGFSGSGGAGANGIVVIRYTI